MLAQAADRTDRSCITSVRSRPATDLLTLVEMQPSIGAVGQAHMKESQIVQAHGGQTWLRKYTVP